ncbi:MAG TPA: TMEM165/GDT1 family protein, partial [Candidatus Brocadiia bacterium]|nr:TMEM165/GDT1 family protein [Candidatus Brocadiia bacterium]
MDTRLFLSTFVLIFLAELGDKTQLATLARAAGEDAPWSVFLGASVALVLSTLVAVLFGKALNALVPPAVIKTVAGGLFIVFGVMILAAVFRAGKPVVRAPAAAPAPSGVAALVLDTALAFEEATARHYAALAERETDPKMAGLWRWLHEQETGHLR